MLPALLRQSPASAAWCCGGSATAAAAAAVGASASASAFLLRSSSSSGGGPAPRRRPCSGGPMKQRRGFLQAAGGDWEETWRQQTTPWDTGAPAPPLLQLLQRTDGSAPLPQEPGKSRALVGGCGSGYDCWTLARHGWRVTGLDLSPTAVKRAQRLLEEEEQRQEEDKGLWKGSGGGVEFVCGDFFALPEEEEEGGQLFDLIFDYTFLCALPPALRSQWARKTRRLLTPGHGQLVCLLFPVPAAGIDTPVASLNAQEGPPFEVSGALYTQLLEEQEGMERLELSGPRVESIKPRRGREWLGRWRRRP